MVLHVSPHVASIVTPAILAVDGVAIVEHDPRLDAPLADAEDRLRVAADLDGPIGRTRAMYRRIGIDPTKTRPSSEALLRRVRKGGQLPRVNSAVDICNWCSVESQMPFGLYDLDRIDGDAIALRLGAEGEGYVGIRKDHVNVSGRLALVDASGPFGNPTSDSARTMVTLETRRVLFVIFAPADAPSDTIRAVASLTGARVREFLGGDEVSRACS